MQHSSRRLTVYVIDDDSSLRTMISRMIAESPDFSSHPFGSAADFLDGLDGLKPGCILLDLRMPDMDGFTLMQTLRDRGVDWPVIVMTGAGDVPVAVQSMKLGAVEFLEKPIRLDPLLETLERAAGLLDERLQAGERHRQAKARVEQLTGRELEVLQGRLSGQSNKELAQSLGISLRTVEMHRGNMMDRLGVASLAQAVALALEAGVRPPANTTV